MGCDIHLYKEKRVNGQWVTADEWEEYDYGPDEKGRQVPWDKQFGNRNYMLFGLLSKGVRTEHDIAFKRRGLPFDCCPDVAALSRGYGEDGHSHSYLYLHELKDFLAFLQTQTIEVSGYINEDQLKQLRETIEAGSPNWDLLFPYCGWTNQPGHVEFTQDIPATFYVGKELQMIIDSFDGIDGDNHRIVFWFDN